MKNRKTSMKRDTDMTDVEYFEFQEGATGPECEAVGNAAATNSDV